LLPRIYTLRITGLDGAELEFGLKDSLVSATSQRPRSHVPHISRKRGDGMGSRRDGNPSQIALS